jgi:hypothetical protein
MVSASGDGDDNAERGVAEQSARSPFSQRTADVTMMRKDDKRQQGKTDSPRHGVGMDLHRAVQRDGRDIRVQTVIRRSAELDMHIGRTQLSR